MTTFTVSPEHEIVIPKELTERFGMEPGQEFTLMSKGGVIVLVPVRSLGSLEGFAAGISIEGYRDEKDRC
jgi:AbrB family looped-hinge helix DNA binding protein